MTLEHGKDLSTLLELLLAISDIMIHYDINNEEANHTELLLHRLSLLLDRLSDLKHLSLAKK